MGFYRQSSERKWPERAKGTKESQQNLEGHCWTRCVRTSEAMRTLEKPKEYENMELKAELDAQAPKPAPRRPSQRPGAQKLAKKTQSQAPRRPVIARQVYRIVQVIPR
ncbi:hypothetical protein PIB30_058497 [Stylosanthes scabra]|uniref:Uncharacterized protein n=1 Tax=Stylosanthes scabra TaxID=79078 RepID=A0ABU6TJS0_9FABA|nr:hypothetical protein [Stylosanthes scabra]